MLKGGSCSRDCLSVDSWRWKCSGTRGLMASDILLTTDTRPDSDRYA